MNTENKLEDLKDAYVAACNARYVARKAYDTDRNSKIGNYDYFTTSDARDAYNTADKAATAAWDAYITVEQETTNN